MRWRWPFWFCFTQLCNYILIDRTSVEKKIKKNKKSHECRAKGMAPKVIKLFLLFLLFVGWSELLRHSHKWSLQTLKCQNLVTKNCWSFKLIPISNLFFSHTNAMKFKSRLEVNPLQSGPCLSSVSLLVMPMLLHDFDLAF